MRGFQQSRGPCEVDRPKWLQVALGQCLAGDAQCHSHKQKSQKQEGQNKESMFAVLEIEGGKATLGRLPYLNMTSQACLHLLKGTSASQVPWAIDQHANPMQNR